MLLLTLWFACSCIVCTLGVVEGMTMATRRHVGVGGVAWLVNGRRASAYWQLWVPEDMLDFVEKYGVAGDAESVLAAMDKCAETSWMMNMGREKGLLVEDAFRGRKRILEVGTFLGYMTTRMARSMDQDARLTTIEKDEVNFAAAQKILSKALPSSTLDRVTSIRATARDLIGTSRDLVRGGPFDAVLLDHWKPDYAPDLDLLAKSGLLAKGALVVADNVLFPGAPELLEYLCVDFERTDDPATGQPALKVKAAAEENNTGSSSMFDTYLVATPFEYRPETPDAMSFSTYKGRYLPSSLSASSY